MDSRKKSIKNKLVRLFLIMGIIPSLLVMLIMYLGVSSHLAHQTGNNLQILASETALRVEMFIRNKMDNALKYASYSTLKRFYFPNGMENTGTEFVRSLFKFDSNLYNITLLNEKKEMIFSYRPNLSAMESPDPYWERALTLREGELLLSGQFDPPPNNPYLLEVITPLFSEINQKRLGFLICSFDLKGLVSMIESIPVSGQYYISLITAKGRILADTRRDSPVSLLPGNMTSLFFSDSNGWKLANDSLEKCASVFGYSSVPVFDRRGTIESSLRVFISRKKGEAFKPVWMLLIKLFAFCIAVILFILLIFIFRIETIWKPILALKKGAEMIGSGNFDMKLFIDTRDELEDLARTFNTMGENLKNSHKTLEEQNKKLVELNNVKNNFISMVSHELRTPLMIIKEAVGQILEGLKGPINQEQQEFLTMASRNADRLNRIIQDLLTISKIETGKMKFNRKHFDLIKLLENEILNQKIKIDTRNLTLIRDYLREKIMVYGDEEKIHMVFTNLLGNSIKFIRTGGTIEVGVGINLEENFIKVCVKDNGPGIPKDSLGKIFERFVKLNTTPLSGAPSTGLGLSIARELVEMHSGRIWAESDGENGSAFFFTLPLYCGKDYLEVYSRDRILEAEERSLEFSIFNLFMHPLTKDREVFSRDKKRMIFAEIQKISLKHLFEPLEIIVLEDTFEFFIFSFLDLKSAEVLAEKIREIIQDYFVREKLDAELKTGVVFAVLKTHGNKSEELFSYLQAEKFKIHVSNGLEL